MPNVRLSLVVLKSREVERVRTFYASLGIELVEERHGTGPIHYAAQLGDVVLEVYPLSEDSPAADATTRVGFVVDDMGQTLQALDALDTPVLTGPKSTQWGVRAVVRDPDGRAVELYQR